jgi:hypothetical protein
MSNPTRSASARNAPAVGGGKKVVARKRPRWKAPTILTYTDDSFMKENGPAKAARGLRPTSL